MAPVRRRFSLCDTSSARERRTRPPGDLLPGTKAKKKVPSGGSRLSGVQKRLEESLREARQALKARSGFISKALKKSAALGRTAGLRRVSSSTAKSWRDSIAHFQRRLVEGAGFASHAGVENLARAVARLSRTLQTMPQRTRANGEGERDPPRES
jgi:hypothetical protein